MDSLTHIAIGACVGEAFFGKGFGKKAMLWGAIAQSVPDIDFVAGAWMNTPQELLAHRGFTHSILFAFLIVPVFAMLANRIHRTQQIAFSKWILFFTVEVFLHLFLDGFNNYGIGWLEPFSTQRFSFNTIYVADLFFSIWPVIALLMLASFHRFHAKRKFWWKFGLILPAVYLLYCTYNKVSIDKEVKAIFVAQKIPHEHYFTTPTPLNNWLWYVVAGNDSGYYVGFRSVFDTKPTMDFHFFPRNDSLLQPIKADQDVKRLIRFSQGFYTIAETNGKLVLNDLRFGQILGWQQPTAPFVFHYFLQAPEDNKLVVQRGRLSGWNKAAFLYFIERIKGN